jgi:hypothetical protein
VIVLVVILALLTATLVGGVLGAWLTLHWVQTLRPGREGELLAELAAVRASEGLHLAAMAAESAMRKAGTQPGVRS